MFFPSTVIFLIAHYLYHSHYTTDNISPCIYNNINNQKTKQKRAQTPKSQQIQIYCQIMKQTPYSTKHMKHTMHILLF